MNEDFNIVLSKVRAFIKKYYLYRVIRGVLSVLVAFILLYLTLMFFENEFYFSSTVRTVLFHTSIVFIGLLSVVYIIYPLLWLTGILKSKGKSRITGLIGSYFPDVRDRLINVMELKEMSEGDYSMTIIQAAISQKSKDLSLFNFSEAIKMRNLMKIGLYFTASIFVSLIIYSVDQSFFIEPANRIIHFKQAYLRPAPFQFNLMNEELKVKKGEGFNVKMKCTGEDLPSLVYLVVEGNQFLMKRMEEHSFEYELPSVIHSLNMHFTDLKFQSNDFRLEVMEIPVINSYKTIIVPPAYTLIKEEIKVNSGDLNVPKGSKVNWSFECYDTDSLLIKLKSGADIQAIKENGKMFSAGYVFRENSEYEVLLKNKQTDYESVMKFFVEIKEDLYPEIKIVQIEDSAVVTRFYFTGSIRDDYGFTKLSFHVTEEEKDSVLDLNINKGLNQQDFYYSIDLMDFREKLSEVKYYFSVTDNDMVNQPKTTLSDTYIFKFPSEKELEMKKDENFQNLEKLISDSKLLTQEIKENIKNLQMKSINSSVSEWEKSQLVNEIINDKNQLEDILDRIEELNRSGNNFQNTFEDQGEEIAQKQKEIEELLDDVMTDELKKLLDEFNKLAEEFNEKKFNEMNQKMDLSLDDLSKQLDRNLEMLKKFKIEQKIEKVIQKIDEIKENEAQYSEEILKNKDYEEALKNLEKDDQEMEDVRINIDEIQKENEELKKPLIFDRFEQEQKDIREEMEKTKSSLQKKNRKESSDGMKNTATKLENLSFALKQMLKANNSERKGENILTIKRILKNLLYISVNQEDILKDLSSINNMDPILREIKVKQRVLTEQFVVVKDSLYALANRAPQVGNMVNEEILAVNINMNESVKLLDENDIPKTGVNQRMVITAANNLILFLSDIVTKMEDMDMEGAGADADCENGQSGKKMGGLKKSGGSIKDQLQNMIDQMKKGQGKSMSREMSDALMQHEMMQKALRELINSGGLGNEGKKALQEMDNLLEQNRKEIMNKQVNQQMITRHNQIMTKLLEAENSENERDLDKKRESETADEKFYSNPAKFFEDKEIKNTTLENLQRNPLKLTGFYREKQRVYMEKSLLNGDR